MSQLAPKHMSWPLVTVAAALEALTLRYSKDELKLSSLALSFGIFFIANLAICGLYFTFIYPFYVSPTRHLPTVGNRHWLMGHMPQLYSSPPGECSRTWNKEVEHDGLLRFFMFFNQERLIAISPKAIADITVANSYAWEKPGVVRAALSTVTGVGLITSEGDEHRRQRRSMLPAFNFRHIKDLYPIFWDKSREVVSAMTKTVHGREGQLHVSHWASLATLDIIGMAAMGRDFDAVRDPDNKLVAQYTRVFEGQSLLRVFLVLGLVLPQWMIEELPLPRIREFRDAMRAIRRVCQELIDEKRAKLRAQKQDKAQPDVDILSIALESGQFTDEGLQNQLMTFFAAGHETTSVSLTWAIYALCVNPAMQTRLREEVRAHLPSVDDDAAAVSSVDFDRLPYLNAVVNEVLRRYPSVPVTGRVAMQDTTVLGRPVARGTAVTIPQWAINVDKTLWGEDAEEFNPDRWLDTRNGSVTLDNTGGSTSNYALSTFLHGPRSCIGAAFAKGEFACLLAAWIGRFEFEFVDKTLMDPDKLKVKGGVTIKPEDGLHVIARVVPGY
ncbi:cytochrome P450 78A3 [Cordyceps fumosorosea ARSEF 2679]|uniref:Cytochrome P450 78A3 n=1 Tax=Cordyceps fumosorosea (strain ARSEF 2679) TaxID=1081104 RepID=A0A162JB03_CORFA|nr:cytochrome P450 78A3 [Cordyceps fumosorosea ARSEF 2679]OAA41828.1 cytochrome P450 78A3 [Cordyceps fumosorosea ARSEF 2679]